MWARAEAGGPGVCPGWWGLVGARLPKLRRGTCGERRLLRPRHGCGAGGVWGRAAHPMGCGHPAARGSCGHRELCAENEAPHTPQLGLCSHEPMARPLSALTVLTCLLCTCREGDLTPADRGDQSWAGHCRAGRASCPPFSACLAEASTRLPWPDKAAVSALCSVRCSPSSLQNIYPKSYVPLHLPVLRTRTLAVLGCRRDRVTLFLQSKAESWEGSSLAGTPWPR